MEERWFLILFSEENFSINFKYKRGSFNTYFKLDIVGKKNVENCSWNSLIARKIRSYSTGLNRFRRKLNTMLNARH